MHAAHGQALVVAASHLILRLRQPSHALITTSCQQWSEFVLLTLRTFEAFVSVVLVDEDIVCSAWSVSHTFLFGML